jgi:NitT/TauT family transport system substrate-binding protein
MRATLSRVMRGALVALGLTLGWGPAAAQDKLVFLAAGSIPSIVYLPVYVAEQAGYFKDEGLAVEVRYARGGPLTVQLVASGDADVGHIVWEPALQAYAKGVRGKFIYQTFTRSSFFLAVKADSGIKSGKDLAGKRIGVGTMQSPGIFMANSIARAAGVDPKSMTFVPVGVGASSLAALEDNKIDVLSFWDTLYAEYEAAGAKLSYIRHPVLGDVGNGGFYALESNIKAKHAAFQKFTRAIAKATAFLLAAPEAALHMYWKVSPSAKRSGNEAEALQKGLQALRFVSHTWDVSRRPDKQFGAINLGQLQSFIDIYKAEGGLDKPIEAKDVATSEFTAQANAFDLAKVQAEARNWRPR